MRILDRYILKSVIVVFLLALFSFFFLYIVIDIFSNLEEIIEQKTSMLILKDYYFSFLPVIFIQMAPIACLLAVLFSIGKLNSNNEIIPMRSAGLNSWQISKSVILFSIIVSLVIFAVNEKVVPGNMASSEKIKNQYIDNPSERLSLINVINNLTFYGRNNRLFFIDAYYPKSNSLEGLTILEQDEHQNIKSKIFAKSGRWQNNQWVFFRCQIFYFDRHGQIEKDSEYFDEKVMDDIKETPEEFTKQQIQIAFMNIEQLKDYLSRFTGTGATAIIQGLKVDLHQRVAYPFSNLVITFVGLPFALMKQRRKGITFMTLGICIAIGFLYYVTNAICIALGKIGILIPFVSAWLPNLIFLSVGIYLLKKIS